jgi:predicted ATP-dependent endonuclease of OLD family
LKEPEAHLLSANAEVFIKKLDEISNIFSQTYYDNQPWPVQFIVTTHSSYVASSASFEHIRYFSQLLEVILALFI